jgi:RimJ/RimL family protein N-acetyltransferase
MNFSRSAPWSKYTSSSKILQPAMLMSLNKALSSSRGPWGTIEEAKSWIEDIQNAHGSLMCTIRLKADQPASTEAHSDPASSQIVGLLGLSPWETLHYMLHPDYWSRGYMTEALSAYLPMLFTFQTDRQYVRAFVWEGNSASVRVLQKCGFLLDENGKGRRFNDDFESHGADANEKETEEVEEEEDEADEVVWADLKQFVHSMGLVAAPVIAVRGGRSIGGKAVYWRYERPPHSV